MTVAIVISMVAVVISGLSFTYNYRANKRDLMIRIHDQLLSAERQHGRRLLYEMCEQGRTPTDLSDEEFRIANNALAWLEFMAVLFDRRHIPRRDALASWGMTVMRTFDAAERCGFIQLRDSQQGTVVWPYLRKLVATARAKGITAPSPTRSTGA